MSLHLLLLAKSPLQALTGQVPDISFLLHFTFVSQFITRLTRVTPTPSFCPNPMRSVATGSVLQRTRGTNSLGRSAPLILRRSSYVCLSEVPFRLPPTRGSLCCQGRDTRLISHQNLFFVMLPLLMKNLASCPPLTLMTSQGEPSFFLFERMGSKKACIIKHITHLEDSQVAHERSASPTHQNSKPG